MPDGCSSDTSGLLRSNLVFSLEFLHVTTLDYLFLWTRSSRRSSTLDFAILRWQSDDFLVQFSILYAGKSISRQIIQKVVLYLGLPLVVSMEHHGCVFSFNDFKSGGRQIRSL